MQCTQTKVSYKDFGSDVGIADPLVVDPDRTCAKH